MTREQELQAVSDKMDAILKKVRARMEKGDPSIIMLRPAAADWMTDKESTEMHKLQMRYYKLRPTTAELKARVKAKREARRKARKAKKAKAQESTMSDMSQLVVEARAILNEEATSPWAAGDTVSLRLRRLAVLKTHGRTPKERETVKEFTVYAVKKKGLLALKPKKTMKSYPLLLWNTQKGEVTGGGFNVRPLRYEVLGIVKARQAANESKEDTLTEGKRVTKATAKAVVRRWGSHYPADRIIIDSETITVWFDYDDDTDKEARKLVANMARDLCVGFTTAGRKHIIYYKKQPAQKGEYCDTSSRWHY
jgi:hypothetical protein